MTHQHDTFLRSASMSNFMLACSATRGMLLVACTVDVRRPISEARPPCLQTQNRMRLGAAMRAVVRRAQTLALSLTPLRQRALAPWRLEFVQRAWTTSQALKGQLPMVSSMQSSPRDILIEWLQRTA